MCLKNAHNYKELLYTGMVNILVYMKVYSSQCREIINIDYLYNIWHYKCNITASVLLAKIYEYAYYKTVINERFNH